MKRIGLFIIIALACGAGCTQTRRDGENAQEENARETPPGQSAERQGSVGGGSKGAETVRQHHGTKPAQEIRGVSSLLPPVRVSGSPPVLSNYRITRVPVRGNYVALTFDDGPSAAYTPKVLNTLARHGAKATFFVLGANAARNKKILARAASEGHEIASHTWSHVKLTGKGAATVVSQMDRTAAVVREATGKAPALMRPPYGATDRTLVNFMMKRYGTPSVLWDIDTEDWRHPGVGVVISRAVNKARPGSIILLHDIHASTAAAVEGVVKGLQARGFRLVTVSELLRLGYGCGVPAPVPGGEAAPGNSLPPTEDGTAPGQPPITPAEPTAPPQTPVVAARRDPGDEPPSAPTERMEQPAVMPAPSTPPEPGTQEETAAPRQQEEYP